jgi:hypothetical protein
MVIVMQHVLVVHNELDQLTWGSHKAVTPLILRAAIVNVPGSIPSISILTAYFNNINFDARSEVLRAALMKIQVFCNFLPICTA